MERLIPTSYKYLPVFQLSTAENGAENPSKNENDRIRTYTNFRCSQTIYSLVCLARFPPLILTKEIFAQPHQGLAFEPHMYTVIPTYVGLVFSVLRVCSLFENQQKMFGPLLFVAHACWPVLESLPFQCPLVSFLFNLVGRRGVEPRFHRLRA